MYKFGTIVLIPFPFTDLSSSKLRPALIISQKNTFEDIIVAFISSNTTHCQNGVYLEDSYPVFSQTGLKASSVIRFDKIATLSKKIVAGELGSLPSEFLHENKEVFFDVFGF